METKIVQEIRLSKEGSAYLGFTICPAYHDAYKVDPMNMGFSFT